MRSERKLQATHNQRLEHISLKELRRKKGNIRKFLLKTLGKKSAAFAKTVRKYLSGFCSANSSQTNFFDSQFSPLYLGISMGGDGNNAFYNTFFFELKKGKKIHATPSESPKYKAPALQLGLRGASYLCLDLCIGGESIL